MKDTELLQIAVMLTPPWRVVSSDIDATLNHVNIDLDFTRGSRFSCPKCGKTGCDVHDTENKTWRHLNFFRHETYLHARVPRSDCPDCGVRLVDVPWARPGSGFTLLFEAYIMLMAPSMAVKKIGELVSEHDTRLWLILHHHVRDARSRSDYSSVTKLGVDETSSRRGHIFEKLF